MIAVKSGFLIVVSCVISLLIGEALVAKFLPQNLSVWGMTRDKITTHVPGVSVYMNQFGQQITINSYGMRDREHALQKPKGTYRILVLGDSFMEALQLRFDESFPSMLERELAAATGRNIEAINGSVSGWGTDDELAYLTRYGLQFQPDLVLVGMTLHNDVTDNLLEEFHGFAGGRLIEKPKEEMPFLDYSLFGLKAFLARHSHLMQLYLKFSRGAYNTQAASSLRSHVANLIDRAQDPSITRGWAMTTQLLDKTRAVSEQAGAKLAVFLLPLAIQVSEQSLDGFLKDQRMKKEDIVIDQPQQIMFQWGQSSGVPVIDLLPQFRAWESEKGDTLFLKNDGHWTLDAHRLAVQVVAPRLMRDLIVRAGRE